MNELHQWWPCPLAEHTSSTPPLARWRLSWWLNVFIGESQEPVWGSGCSMPLRPESQVQNCPLQWSLLFELGQVTSSQPHYPTGWLWWGKRRKKSYLLLWAPWRRGGISLNKHNQTHEPLNAAATYTESEKGVKTDCQSYLFAFQQKNAISSPQTKPSLSSFSGTTDAHS